jgi:hypothetical protein
LYNFGTEVVDVGCVVDFGLPMLVCSGVYLEDTILAILGNLR